MSKTANAQGRISGEFLTPPRIPAGTKRVSAVGRGGTRATALYTGQGRVDTQTLRRVFSTRFWTRTPPVIVTPPTITATPTTETPGNDQGRGDGNDPDPLAQTFRLPASSRHVTSVDVIFTAIGERANGTLCQIREVQLGVPGPTVFGEAFVNMAAVVIGAKTTFTFRAPVFLEAGVEYALVFLTDDGAHALAIATGGEFDAAKQQWVTGQPYAPGVLLSGSNTSTWTAHQKSDLAFWLRAARFTATERIVAAGTFPVINCSDLVVRAGSEIPAADTSVLVRITRASGEQIHVRPGQPIQFTEPFSETLRVDLVLRGTALHSPLAYPVVQVIVGTIAGTANYITRAMAASGGTNPARITVRCEVFKPGAAIIAAHVAPSPANPALPIAWGAGVALAPSADVGDGWAEYTGIVDGYMHADARAQIIVSGSARDRLLVRNLRVITTDAPVNAVA